MTTLVEDRESIGLYPENVTNLATVLGRGWFAEGQDLARFCLAYAIRSGVEEPDLYEKSAETRWAAGNFDNTGEIRALIAALYPDCKTPVRLMQHLVNEGLRLVAERVASSNIVGPAQLMD